MACSTTEGVTNQTFTATLPSKNPKMIVATSNAGNGRTITSLTSTNGYTVNLLSKNTTNAAYSALAIFEVIGDSGASVNFNLTYSWNIRGFSYGWLS